jgi:O-methyltransferase involved in polyketide biosynthesis
MESQRPDALVRDPKAVELVGQLHYDFSGVQRLKDEQVNYVLRMREFDRLARVFLAEHPGGVIVDLGCGLDTRFERIDNGRVEWYGLDLPEVIELRKELLDETPRSHFIGCSVLDNAWLEPVSVHGQRPFLFLAEGVFMYLEGAQVKSLVLTLRDRFPGAELAFDAYSPIHVWRHNLQTSTSKISFPARWGIWHGQEIEGWGDGIHLLDEWCYLDPPEPRVDAIRWLRPIEALFRTIRTYHFRLGKATG